MYVTECVPMYVHKCVQSNSVHHTAHTFSSHCIPRCLCTHNALVCGSVPHLWIAVSVYSLSDQKRIQFFFPCFLLYGLSQISWDTASGVYTPLALNDKLIISSALERHHTVFFFSQNCCWTATGGDLLNQETVRAEMLPLNRRAI